MTGLLLRFLIIAVIVGAIYWGLRRIWRDWTANFRAVDKERHERDLHERAQPGVIELKRNKDGVFRPPDEKPRT